MFNDLLKTDDYRRQRAVRPQPPAQNAWMGAGLTPQPPQTQEQMIQILTQSPGMTPDLLRTILEDRKNKMATQPTFAPGTMVAGANLRNPL